MTRRLKEEESEVKVQFKPSCPNCNKLRLLFKFCWDNPDTDYAFNIFCCDYCGAVIREDVWDNKGLTITNEAGDITKVSKEDREKWKGWK